MKKGIRAINYIKNNRKRTAVLVVSLGFFITMLYGLSYLLNITATTMTSAYIKSSEKMQIIMPEFKLLEVDQTIFEDKSFTDLERNAELTNGLNKMAKKFKEGADIDYAIPCYTIYVPLKSVIGYTNFSAVFTDKKSVGTILDYMGATLLQGKLPLEEGELVVDLRFAKNQKLSIGDHFLGSDYTVSGIVSCDYYFVCGINNGTYGNFGITFLADGKKIDYASLCNFVGYSADQISISDYPTGIRSYKKEIGDSIEFSKNLITIISTLVLSLCIIVVFHMYIRDRYEEWCLYHSIGYSIKEVYLSALNELLITFFISTGFASALSIAVVLGFQFYIIEPLGLMSTPFMPDTFFQIFSILVLLYGLLQLPLFIAMHKIRTIDAIKEDYL